MQHSPAHLLTIPFVVQCSLASLLNIPLGRSTLTSTSNDYSSSHTAHLSSLSIDYSYGFVAAPLPIYWLFLSSHTAHLFIYWLFLWFCGTPLPIYWLFISSCSTYLELITTYVHGYGAELSPSVIAWAEKRADLALIISEYLSAAYMERPPLSILTSQRDQSRLCRSVQYSVVSNENFEQNWESYKVSFQLIEF